MSYPKGPRPETEALIKKAVKAAGKKGKSILQIALALDVELSVARRVVMHARKAEKLSVSGQGRRTVYLANA